MHFRNIIVGCSCVYRHLLDCTNQTLAAIEGKKIN